MLNICLRISTFLKLKFIHLLHDDECSVNSVPWHLNVQRWPLQSYDSKPACQCVLPTTEHPVVCHNRGDHGVHVDALHEVECEGGRVEEVDADAAEERSKDCPTIRPPLRHPSRVVVILLSFLLLFDHPILWEMIWRNTYWHFCLIDIKQTNLPQ